MSGILSIRRHIKMKYILVHLFILVVWGVFVWNFVGVTAIVPAMFGYMAGVAVITLAKG